MHTAIAIIYTQVCTVHMYVIPDVHMYCQIVSVENGGQVPTAGMNTCALMPYAEVGYAILVNSNNEMILGSNA